MSTIVSKKIEHIFKLLTMLLNNNELYPQDVYLQNELEVSERTLRRYLEDIHSLFNHIVITEKIKIKGNSRKVDAYRLLEETDISRVLKYFINNDTDIEWVVRLILENDPNILENFSSSDRRTLENSIQQGKDDIKFISQPFEVLNEFQKKNFKSLKTAVKNIEYRTIAYKFDKDEIIVDAKCLKILFISNNWYLAVEVEEKLRLLRIAFISNVSYSKHTTYQKKVLERYARHFETIQNAFTLYGVENKKAILKISPERANYFLPEMKPFFSSQRWLETNDKGYVKISIEYTQSLEILPFIKQWLPHIQILEPKNLDDELKQDLVSYLAHTEQKKPYIK